MAKYENIRALAKKQLQAVTESSDRWKAFLQTAAIAYNYSFPNQLLIHGQSPTATAVADIAYWNNNAGRWVKRGAHGIAVFDTRANSSRLRYLFDISDTIPRAEVPEALPWVITDQNWRPVWDKIVADNHADSIQSALLMLSTSCVAQRSAMFTTALGKAIDGSSLQWAKPDEQRQLFLQLITQSCLYMAALRCGVDTARLDLSALESVNQFDTNRIALCLGSACQQAARPLMQQIGSITREIDSVARAEKVRYYGDKQEETNNTKEVNNGVHDGERLPNPGADAERAADAGNREVRQPAAEIPAGERPDDVRRDDAGGNAVPASGGDGQRSTSANRTDHADADAAEHRPEPADRPDGLDAVDERLAEPSRGTGDAADLQPVIQEPQAESDTTPSAFSVPISDLPPLSDELILGLLAKESSSRADNAAILEYFNEHPDLAERSAFCKHCYKQIYLLDEYVFPLAFDGMPADDAEIILNPSGKFVQGGPDADTGLTGRKLMVDSYGAFAPHGGGAFSGKDATKVDRSGAYMARFIAKNIVAAGFAQRCQVTLAYAIGEKEPVMVDVNTFGTGGPCEDDCLSAAVRKAYDLTPAGIIKQLDLLNPIYNRTAAGGHFGREDFPWENIEHMSDLAAYIV